MDSEADILGRTFDGRWRVTGFLGEGAMARVYRGVEQPEGRAVDTKVPNSELARDETIRRFRREARATMALKHPNIVTLLDHGVEGNLAYIVMELIDGRDLFDVLATDGKLTEARGAHIMI